MATQLHFHCRCCSSWLSYQAHAAGVGLINCSGLHLEVHTHRVLVLGLQEVITADVVEFEAARSAFDRVVSVEMFEHMKNYQARRSAACLTQHTVDLQIENFSWRVWALHSQTSSSRQDSVEKLDCTCVTGESDGQLLDMITACTSTCKGLLLGVSKCSSRISLQR